MWWQVPHFIFFPCNLITSLLACTDSADNAPKHIIVPEDR